MLNKIKKFYTDNMFKPTLFGFFFNPFYIARKQLLKHILLNLKYLHGTLLDFGCGNKPYAKFFNVNKYVGLCNAPVFLDR